jgi:16S rRNA C967 or C1407 C5-methylase (RsmB/RsmF family)/NOL1/NOP2/fmu family ribosome biogenesis protein
MTSLPQDFIARIENDTFVPTGLLQALEESAPTSVRLHPQRKSNFLTTDRVAWSSSGIYLPERPAFTYDPLFHAGAYYPQEAGSMYLEKALAELELPENPVVLDLSAAPGGKSTLIASFLNHKGVLIANEINRSRAYILSENLTKWGYANVYVCNHKPSELSCLQGQVDVLVVDAPCSGEGMFRKDHQARAEWHLGNAATCASRQTDILDEVWPLLKEGGYLLYSTCTFNPEENENQLLHLLDEEGAVKVKLPHFEGLQADRHEIGQYFFPNQIKSEGFYIAALQKTSRTNTKHRPAKNNVLNNVIPKELSAFLLQTQELCYWQEADQVYAATPFARSIYGQIKDLKFLKKGTHVATAHKKSWAPGYDLTYSLFPVWNLPTKAVEAPEALRILHGESQQWEAPAGFYIVTFEGQAIAMIKQIGQRFNNLHPTEWRIRHLPK